VVTAATPTQLTVTVPVGATYQPISVSVNNLIAYSSKPFITTFAGGGTIDACSFAPKQDLTAGMFPLSIVSGDFDGDGKADMAVANYDNNIISLFRNTSSIGSISYAPKIDITSGSNTDHISTEDLDGDGKLDLVVTDVGGASVYRNTSTGPGTISFAARINFATSSDPRHLGIDDFDKDGKPDLVVANYGAGVNTISVLRNTSSGPGNITYAPKVDFASTVRPSSVSAGDLDGDGKPDIAVVNQNSNTLSIFRNTSTGVGNISFATKVDFTTEQNPLFVSIGDLDDDNKPELAIGYSLGNSVISVFRNLSSGIGNINFAPKADFALVSVPFSVHMGDLDGDGKPDLVATSVSSGSASIFRNTSTGIGNISFAAKVDFATNSNSQSVSITDFDGDGKPDLAATSFFGVHVLRNTISLPPSITSFAPTDGAVGTTVIITGADFSLTPANNIVSFNGTAAVVTASTSTSITTTVPTGATSGAITVTICNTATSATNFTVTGGTPNQPPQITTTSASVPIQGLITIDLEELISDPDDNLDPSTLQIITQPLSGAVASLNNFVLTIDYAGIAFSGTDKIEIGICDLTGVCTQQELTLELAGEIEVFNALSPNGDGQNEFLLLRYIELLADTQSNQVSIYNRWGDVVWEGSNYNNQTVVFDGTNKNGKELPSGTYFYKIEFSGGLETKTGFLSLKR
jgi:gliding motility-associated-like protein